MRVWRRVIVAAIAASAVMPLASVSPAWAAPPNCTTVGNTVTCNYSSTGSEHQFTVPTGVTSVEVRVVGGKAGAGLQNGSFSGTPGAGGFGADVLGTLPVTPGDTLFLLVAGNGTSSESGGAGGFNGGGDGAGYSGLGSGGGGGASDVRTVSCGSPCDPLDSPSLASRLLVAAGGGGGGAAFNDNGGAGGRGGLTADAGMNGSDVPSYVGSGGQGGGGADLTQGGSAGAAGTGSDPALPGTGGAAGQGGIGQVGDNTQNPGGGGGGGYYGGGGGGSGARTASGQVGGGGGGGGGSSFLDASVTNSTVSTDATGVPSITISFTATRQVDGWIRRGPHWFIGNDVYGTDGTGQTQVMHPVVGARVLFRIAAQNDGHWADRIQIHATGGLAPGYRIRYYRKGKDITTAVVNGTFTTPTLQPGRRFTIEAWVRVRAHDLPHVSRLVTLTSVQDPSKVDAVKFVVDPR